jgi:hypothetical protein
VNFGSRRTSVVVRVALIVIQPIGWLSMLSGANRRAAGGGSGIIAQIAPKPSPKSDELSRRVGRMRQVDPFLSHGISLLSKPGRRDRILSH